MRNDTRDRRRITDDQLSAFRVLASLDPRYDGQRYHSCRIQEEVRRFVKLYTKLEATRMAKALLAVAKREGGDAPGMWVRDAINEGVAERLAYQEIRRGEDQRGAKAALTREEAERQAALSQVFLDGQRELQEAFDYEDPEYREWLKKMAKGDYSADSGQ